MVYNQNYKNNMMSLSFALDNTASIYFLTISYYGIFSINTFPIFSISRICDKALKKLIVKTLSSVSL